MTPLNSAFAWLWPEEFAHPMRLFWLLLIPAGIALYVIARKLRKNNAMRYTNTAIMGRVMGSQKEIIRHLAVAFSLLTIITLSIANAIPLALDRVPRQRATVVLIIDTSRSMESTDVAPNRLAAAKKAATDFVDKLPDGFNVSIVSLAGNSSMEMPPMTDKSAAKMAIDKLGTQDSTAVGEALIIALEAVSRAPKGDDGSVAPASIVLLSDGTSNMGRSPIQAAQEAKAKGVRIYTVAYGTETGYVDIDGKREIVAPDKTLMTQIAQETGGEMVSADSPQSLERAYKNLQTKVGYDEVRTEVTARWAGLGLAFGILAALAAVLLAARWQ